MINKLTIKSAVFLISFYQGFLNPLLKLVWPGGNCFYRPTCSDYFKQAIEKYGLVKGSQYGFKRLARCNPVSQGGFDPLT